MKYFAVFIYYFGINPIVQINNYTNISEYKIINNNDNVKKSLDPIPEFDWKINNNFEIGTKNGLRKYLGLKRWNEAQYEYHNKFIFYNKNKKESCKIETYLSGSIKIRVLNISYNNYKKIEKNKNNIATNISYFYTNRKIKLGMSEGDFIKKSKGMFYKVTRSKKISTYEYYLKANFKSIVFGETNEYLSVYTFENNKLSYISISCL